MTQCQIISVIEELDKRLKLPNEIFIYIISFIGSIYRDENISILHPRDFRNGVLIAIQRNVYNRYKIFKAPYFSPPAPLSNLSDRSKIISLYGEIEPHTIFIRVDPDNTYVFSSLIKQTSYYYNCGYKENLLRSSRKTLTEYLRIINDNVAVNKNRTKGKMIWYNLYSSKAVEFPILPNTNWTPRYPFTDCLINTSSEINVDIRLTPNYFIYI